MPQELKTVVLVVAAWQYDVTDKETGEVNRGTSVRYITNNELTPREDTKKTTKGHKPAKASMEFEDYPMFSVAPALYEMDSEVDVGTDGKAYIKPTAFKFLCGITVSKAATGSKINLNAKES